MRNHQPSSFENFMSFNNHYGTNRQILQPSLEIQKQLLSHEKSAPRFDRSSDLNSGIKSDNALSNINYIRNSSTEELISNKCSSNHSPMLTKRKDSQHKSGSNTVRGKYKQHKTRSNFVSLNSNLRNHGKLEADQRKSVDRSKAGKLSADASSKLQLKCQLENQNMLHDALFNVEFGHSKMSDKKNMINWNIRNPMDLMDNFRTLEDHKDNNQILPTSTISTNRRQYTQSRQSSRNSRNRSTSNSQQKQKYIPYSTFSSLPLSSPL